MMNFDGLDKILDQVDDEDRNATEYAILQSVDLGEKYKGAAYSVPFSCIDMRVVSSMLIESNHKALLKTRTSKFTEDEFEDVVGEDVEPDPEQPSFAEAIADYLNVTFATIIYKQVERLQKANKIDMVFSGDDFVYKLVDEQDEQEFGEVVDYANIFL